MNTFRTGAPRAVRIAQSQALRSAIRHQSTTSQATNAARGSSGALVGGAIGGATACLGLYAWYHFSGAKTLVNTASATKKGYENMVKAFQRNTPEPDEALSILRNTALSYAAFIPGAKGYVNSAFDDIETVRRKRGGEVDKIVKEGYGELQQLSKQEGASIETAQKAWQILQKHLERLGSLASDSAEDILNNHPELKKQLGGSVAQLKSMGQNYGGEAKKTVDQTWRQVRDALKGGVNPQSIDKVKQIIEQAVQKVKSAADDSFNKGWEELKPQLDKNPKIKELVEKNKEKLMGGNVGELWSTLKDAMKSGDTGKVEDYIKSAVDKTKKSAGGSFSQLFEKVPGGSDILGRLSKLQGIAQEHGDEAEKLVKDTYHEILEVVKRKQGDAQKIVDKAGKEASK